MRLLLLQRNNSSSSDGGGQSSSDGYELLDEPCLSPSSKATTKSKKWRPSKNYRQDNHHDPDFNIDDEDVIDDFAHFDANSNTSNCESSEIDCHHSPDISVTASSISTMVVDNTSTVFSQNNSQKSLNVVTDDDVSVFTALSSVPSPDRSSCSRRLSHDPDYLLRNPLKKINEVNTIFPAIRSGSSTSNSSSSTTTASRIALLRRKRREMRYEDVKKYHSKFPPILNSKRISSNVTAPLLFNHIHSKMTKEDYRSYWSSSNFLLASSSQQQQRALSTYTKTEEINKTRVTSQKNHQIINETTSSSAQYRHPLTLVCENGPVDLDLETELQSLKVSLSSYEGLKQEETEKNVFESGLCHPKSADSFDDGGLIGTYGHTMGFEVQQQSSEQNGDSCQRQDEPHKKTLDRRKGPVDIDDIDRQMSLLPFGLLFSPLPKPTSYLKGTSICRNVGTDDAESNQSARTSSYSSDTTNNYCALEWFFDMMDTHYANQEYEDTIECLRMVLAQFENDKGMHRHPFGPKGEDLFHRTKMMGALEMCSNSSSSNNNHISCDVVLAQLIKIACSYHCLGASLHDYYSFHNESTSSSSCLSAAKSGPTVSSSSIPLSFATRALKCSIAVCAQIDNNSSSSSSLYNHIMSLFPVTKVAPADCFWRLGALYLMEATTIAASSSTEKKYLSNQSFNLFRRMVALQIDNDHNNYHNSQVDDNDGEGEDYPIKWLEIFMGYNFTGLAVLLSLDSTNSGNACSNDVDTSSDDVTSDAIVRGTIDDARCEFQSALEVLEHQHEHCLLDENEETDEHQIDDVASKSSNKSSFSSLFSSTRSIISNASPNTLNVMNIHISRGGDWSNSSSGTVATAIGSDDTTVPINNKRNSIINDAVQLSEQKRPLPTSPLKQCKTKSTKLGMAALKRISQSLLLIAQEHLNPNETTEIAIAVCDALDRLSRVVVRLPQQERFYCQLRHMRIIVKHGFLAEGTGQVKRTSLKMKTDTNVFCDTDIDESSINIKDNQQIVLAGKGNNHDDHFALFAPFLLQDGIDGSKEKEDEKNEAGNERKTKINTSNADDWQPLFDIHDLTYNNDDFFLDPKSIDKSLLGNDDKNIQAQLVVGSLSSSFSSIESHEKKQHGKSRTEILDITNKNTAETVPKSHANISLSNGTISISNKKTHPPNNAAAITKTSDVESMMNNVGSKAANNNRSASTISNSTTVVPGYATSNAHLLSVVMNRYKKKEENPLVKPVDDKSNSTLIRNKFNDDDIAQKMRNDLHNDDSDNESTVVPTLCLQLSSSTSQDYEEHNKNLFSATSTLKSGNNSNNNNKRTEKNDSDDKSKCGNDEDVVTNKFSNQYLLSVVMNRYHNNNDGINATQGNNKEKFNANIALTQMFDHYDEGDDSDESTVPTLCLQLSASLSKDDENNGNKMSSPATAASKNNYNINEGVNNIPTKLNYDKCGGNTCKGSDIVKPPPVINRKIFETGIDLAKIDAQGVGKAEPEKVHFESDPFYPSPNSGNCSSKSISSSRLHCCDTIVIGALDSAVINTNPNENCLLLHDDSISITTPLKEEQQSQQQQVVATTESSIACCPDKTNLRSTKYEEINHQYHHHHNNSGICSNSSSSNGMVSSRLNNRKTDSTFESMRRPALQNHHVCSSISQLTNSGKSDQLDDKSSPARYYESYSKHTNAGPNYCNDDDGLLSVVRTLEIPSSPQIDNITSDDESVISDLLQLQQACRYGNSPQKEFISQHAKTITINANSGASTNETVISKKEELLLPDAKQYCDRNIEENPRIISLIPHGMKSSLSVLTDEDNNVLHNNKDDNNDLEAGEENKESEFDSSFYNDKEECCSHNDSSDGCLSNCAYSPSHSDTISTTPEYDFADEKEKSNNNSYDKDETMSTDRRGHVVTDSTHHKSVLLAMGMPSVEILEGDDIDNDDPNSDDSKCRRGRTDLPILSQHMRDHPEEFNNLFSIQTVVSHHIYNNCIDKAIDALRALLNYYVQTAGGGEEYTPDVANTYHSMGCVYLQSKQQNVNRQAHHREEALKAFNRAVCIRRGVLCRDHPTVADSLMKAGIVQLKLNSNNYDDALHSFRDALTIRKNGVGELHPLTGNVFNNVGCVYLKRNELSLARQAFESALDIQRSGLACLVVKDSNNNNDISRANNNEQLTKQYRDMKLSVATILCNLGHLYTVQRMYGRCSVVLTEAVPLLVELWGENHRRVLVTFYSLAYAELKQNHNKQALDLFTAVITRLEQPFAATTTTRSSTLSVSSYSSSISLLSTLPCNNDDFFNAHDSAIKGDATSATQGTTISAEKSDYQRVLILERVSKMLMNQRDYESSLNKLQMAMSIIKSRLDLRSSRRAHDSMRDDSDFKTINLEETLLERISLQLATVKERQSDFAATSAHENGMDWL